MRNKFRVLGGVVLSACLVGAVGALAQGGSGIGPPQKDGRTGSGPKPAKEQPDSPKPEVAGPWDPPPTVRRTIAQHG